MTTIEDEDDTFGQDEDELEGARRPTPSPAGDQAIAELEELRARTGRQGRVLRKLLDALGAETAEQALREVEELRAAKARAENGEALKVRPVVAWFASAMDDALVEDPEVGVVSLVALLELARSGVGELEASLVEQSSAEAVLEDAARTANALLELAELRRRLDLRD